MPAEPRFDLSAYDPSALIERWREEFRWANAWDTAQTMTYQRGWFVLRSADGFFAGRYRRKQIEAMIWRLENRKPAFTTQETK